MQFVDFFLAAFVQNPATRRICSGIVLETAIQSQEITERKNDTKYACVRFDCYFTVCVHSFIACGTDLIVQILRVCVKAAI